MPAHLCARYGGLDVDILFTEDTCLCFACPCGDVLRTVCRSDNISGYLHYRDMCYDSRSPTALSVGWSVLVDASPAKSIAVAVDSLGWMSAWCCSGASGF